MLMLQGTCVHVYHTCVLVLATTKKQLVQPALAMTGCAFMQIRPKPRHQALYFLRMLMWQHACRSERQWKKTKLLLLSVIHCAFRQICSNVKAGMMRLEYVDVAAYLQE